MHLSPATFFTHKAYPKNLKALFLAKLFRDYGYAIGTFFFPLFLFQLGPFLPITGVSSFQRGMIAIGLYFFIQTAGVALFSLPASVIIRKIGMKNSMIVGVIIHIISFGLFMSVDRYPILILVALALEIIRVPLYWISYYTLFSTFAVYKKMGESVGTIEFFTKMVQASAPAIAGLLIVGFGYGYVFLIALGLQVIAIFALLFIEADDTISKPSFKEFSQRVRTREYRQISTAYVGKYLTEALYFLWPFFVFFIIGSVDQVGFLYSFVYFISLLIIYFTGWYIDHSKSRTPFSISGMLMGGLWISRAFINTPWSVIVVDSFDKMLGSVFLPFYESLLLRRGKGRAAFSHFVYREIIISLAGVLFWFTFIGYFFIFDSWRSLLILGLIGMLGSIQLKEHKDDEVAE